MEAREPEPPATPEGGEERAHEEGDARFGAHVSAAGGLHTAPARAMELGSRVLQIFTKTPQRWLDPVLSDADADAFRSERARCAIRTVAVHGSYLINTASSDSTLRERSTLSLIAELERCHRIGSDFLVLHPGSATDGDRAAGMERIGRAITRALDEVRPAVRVLLENTAGQGNLLGATPAELAELVARIRDGHGSRGVVGVCLDSCHLYAAGFDIRHRYGEVMERWDDELDLEDVALWHLNDSRGGMGSGVDRHADIGAGGIGIDGFRTLLADPRWWNRPGLIETPKDPDPLTADRRNLRTLRELGRSIRDADRQKGGESRTK